MPSCSGRNILYALMALQLISTLERQIFDFLGYMWVPILGNFLHTLVVILGIFGVYQYTSKHMLTYLVWCIIWMGWNVFLICYYLEVGDLQDPKNDVLSFGTGSFSWWLENSIGCKSDYFPANEADATSFENNIPLTPGYKPVKPSHVTGCVLNYEYVEVIHASIQLVLAIFSLLFGIPLAHYLITVVEPKYRQARGSKKPIANGHAMYSIEYNQVNESGVQGGTTTVQSQETDFYSLEPASNGDVRPHMTPRRVKRRSYTRNSARSAGKALKKDLHRPVSYTHLTLPTIYSV